MGRWANGAPSQRASLLRHSALQLSLTTMTAPSLPITYYPAPALPSLLLSFSFFWGTLFFSVRRPLALSLSVRPLSGGAVTTMGPGDCQPSAMALLPRHHLALRSATPSPARCSGDGRPPSPSHRALGFLPSLSPTPPLVLPNPLYRAFSLFLSVTQSPLCGVIAPPVSHTDSIGRPWPEAPSGLPPSCQPASRSLEPFIAPS